MNNRAEVWLWGRHIAYIELDPKGFVNFEYTKEFQNSGIELAPIMMPLSDRVYSFPELISQSFKGAPGLIADSLPDKFGNAVIDNWLARQGRLPESFNIIERLCYTGKRGMGALEFKPVLSKDYSEVVEIDNLVQLANEVLQSRDKVEVKTDKEDAMNQLFLVGSSAGGARAKAIIAWNKKENIIKSGQIDAGEGYEYYLLKFDGVTENGDYGLQDPQGFTKIEYAYYRMAKDAKITMMESELLKEHGRSHFVTKRFDRVNGQKIHTQTFGSMCHIDYNVPGLASYEMLALRCIQLKLPQWQLDELFRRLVFNVLGVNNDDHVKNFTFLMDKNGNWSLAPAYDMTFSYNSRSLWVSQHQMSIHGKRKDINKEDLFAVAKVMRISRQKTIKIIDEVKEVLKNWKIYAIQEEVNPEFIEMIDSHIQAAIQQIE